MFFKETMQIPCQRRARRVVKQISYIKQVISSHPGTAPSMDQHPEIRLSGNIVKICNSSGLKSTLRQTALFTRDWITR